MSNWKKASEESVHAVWHDPSAYDPMRMGPPYLPGQEVRPVQAKAATSKSRGLEVRELVAAERQSAELTYGMLGGLTGLPALLAVLRALGFLHLTHHWQTQGSSFYGDHLLFERLYSETTPMIDALAERAVGSSSAEAVHPQTQAAMLLQIVESLCEDPQVASADQLVAVSLKGVLQFLAILRTVYEQLESQGLLTHGTDNLLEDIADKHESFAYLLKQRSQTRVSSTRRSWKST